MNLLNCQSAVEGRKVYRCTDDMVGIRFLCQSCHKWLCIDDQGQLDCFAQLCGPRREDSTEISEMPLECQQSLEANSNFLVAIRNLTYWEYYSRFSYKYVVFIGDRSRHLLSFLNLFKCL